MSAYARFRADIDVLEKAKAGSDIRDRYPTDCPVEILEDQGEWLKVKPVRLLYAVNGYVPRVALIFPPEAKPAVFPRFLAGGKMVACVPPTLKLNEFQAWKAAGGKPEWLQEKIWEQLTPAEQNALLQAMTTSIDTNAEAWNAWTGAITVSNRQDKATLEEWIVTLQGGQEVYAIRDHYIYIRPSIDEAYFGCASRGQVMQWTGEVQTFNLGGQTQELKKVRFYRMHRHLDGWFRSDLTQEYIYPDATNDPGVPANGQNVFDLTQPILRHPQDPEITETKNMGYVGAQYINVLRATGKSLVHFCLCGEFCVTTLAGMDIIPLLSNWVNPPAGEKYNRVDTILGDAHEGTSIGDLQSLLSTAGLPAGVEYSSIPATARLYKERLEAGEFAISGCGIDGIGNIKADGSIRHWVILEDVLPVGNSGWVRIYNPFQNREEVYEYNLFMLSVGTGIGLWIQLPEPETTTAGPGIGLWGHPPKPTSTTPPPP
jgi:hypothetical protein